MENELAMVQNEMSESKPSNLPTSNAIPVTQSKIEKPVKKVLDKKLDVNTAKKSDMNTTINENGVTAKNESPKNNLVNDSASILNLIQMVDSKIDKLKDETTKEESKKNIANRTKDSINDDYQRRIMESIMENELAMEQNEVPKQDTIPSRIKDYSTNLSVNANKSHDIKKDMSSEKDGGAKDVFPSQAIGLEKSPKSSPREKSTKKSSSDDNASNAAKSKGDDVPDASNESSYSQIMKYLKTQEEAEEKRNQNRFEENREDKNGMVSSTPTKPSRKNSGDPSSKSKSSEIGVKNGANEFSQDTKNDKSSNDKDLYNGGVPDKLGFKSVGTQTLRVRENKSCSCCCKCKDST